MSKNSTRKEIDLISFEKYGKIRVNDTLYYNSEYPMHWRYDFCIPYEENQKNLARLVYHGIETVDYSLTEKLENYIQDRRSIQEKIWDSYSPVINAILNADIPKGSKIVILSTMNIEIHKLYPYESN